MNYPAYQQSLTLIALIVCFAFLAGRIWAVQLARRRANHLASLPIYYGWYGALGALFPAMTLGLLGWFLPIPSAVLNIAIPLASFIGAMVCLFQISPQLTAQRRVERMIRWLLMASGVVAIMTTLGIILSLVFETFLFFGHPDVSVIDFFTGTEWSAQTSSRFGAVPLFFGTFFVGLIALVIAAPVGLFSAIYMSEYASPRTRQILKPFLEVLAGIPTVVYGFFAILVVAPAVRSAGDGLNDLLRPFFGGADVIATQPKSALAAGIVMGIMIVPFISSLSDDVIRSVPRKLRNGAIGLGATTSETLKDVVLPAAFPGLMAAMLLAVSRAIGETMIVVMAAGERANITLNPFEDVTTVTVQIVALMTGDPAFDSPRTLSAFALGAVLFCITLAFNVLAQWIVDRQRRRYAGF